MSIWFCEIKGAEVGPLTSAELISHIHQGNVDKDTMVRKDDSQWVRAIEINGLFDAAARPINYDVCPYCEHVDPGAVPCKCPGCDREIKRVIRRKEPSPVLPNGERNPDSPRNQKTIRNWMRKLF